MKMPPPQKAGAKKYAPSEWITLQLLPFEKLLEAGWVH